VKDRAVDNIYWNEMSGYIDNEINEWNDKNVCNLIYIVNGCIEYKWHGMLMVYNDYKWKMVLIIDNKNI
jgi:hypothetical protein